MCFIGWPKNYIQLENVICLKSSSPMVFGIQPSMVLFFRLSKPNKGEGMKIVVEQPKDNELL